MDNEFSASNMNMPEITNCPHCGRHCPVEAVSCGRGAAFVRSLKYGGTNESSCYEVNSNDKSSSGSPHRHDFRDGFHEGFHEGFHDDFHNGFHDKFQDEGKSHYEFRRRNREQHGNEFNNNADNRHDIHHGEHEIHHEPCREENGRHHEPGREEKYAHHEPDHRDREVHHGPGRRGHGYHEPGDAHFEDGAHHHREGSPRRKEGHHPFHELPQDNSLESLLIRCAHQLRRGGTKDSQIRVLDVLDRVGEIGQRELQTWLGIQAGSLSELISKLEDKGWIAKTKDDEDRRRLTITITEEGKAALHEVSNSESKSIARNLTEEEQAQLQTLLKKILD